MSFLGLLLDTVLQKVFLPIEKINKALSLINTMLGRKKGKVTVLEIQHLCGVLNFFGKCIILGRAFTRRLYSLLGNEVFQKKDKKLNPNHHVCLKAENKADLRLWEVFLRHPTAFYRDFADFSKIWVAEELNFYTDASRNAFLGAGGYCDRAWFFVQWDKNFIENYDPSIGYLELYACTVGIVLWLQKFKNRKIAIFCDNESVVRMINNNSSRCKNCMVLIRIIVFHCMINNVRLCAKHVRTKENAISDSLSRLNFKKFNQLTKGNFEDYPTRIPKELWLMEKLWLKK